MDGGLITAIYQNLLDRYGAPRWWPAKTPYEVIVGAILTQNTAWGNVEKAVANFNGGLSPEYILNAEYDALIDIIRPAGFYNQKAAYLKAVTAWFAKYNFDVQTVRRGSLAKMRGELLAVNGVGQETADAILLYAFEYPTFVVDAYTFRLCRRYPIPAGESYAAVKAYFEKRLPADTVIYNNYHALIVINGKTCCGKKNPSCGACPLGASCGRTI